jgi:hypothetical protein
MTHQAGTGEDDFGRVAMFAYDDARHNLTPPPPIDAWTYCAHAGVFADRRRQAERGKVEVGRALIDEVLGILDAVIPTANDEIDVDMLVTARDILAGTMSGLSATEQQ